MVSFQRVSLIAMLLLFAISGSTLHAQSGAGFSYQAVARTNAGAVLQNQSINLRFKIRQGAANGTVVYEETHTPLTNTYGLFSVVIGKGTPETGFSFPAIDWSAGDYYLSTEVNGATASTTLFEAVPYSKKALDMKLRDLTDVGDIAPSNGAALKWNGTAWVPGADNTGPTYSAGSGIAISGAGVISNTGDVSNTNEIQTLSLSGNSLSLSNGGGSVSLPSGSETPWTKNGNNIFYSSGNVGIGDNTPSASLSVGNGDKFTVDGTTGGVTFSDDGATIQFPAATATNKPMINMFRSGTNNADRMVIAHSPSFAAWGIEYADNTDRFHFRSDAARQFTVALSSGRVGIQEDNPLFNLDMKGRARIQWQGGAGNSPGIWFGNQAGTFNRAFLGMSEPDSILGIFSQHLGKWAVEFELMREPRIGINIQNGSPPRAELHLYHTNFGGSNDGVRIQNEGANGHYWNLYTSNTTGSFELYKQGIKRVEINPTTGAYSSVSDERLKTNVAAMGSVIPKVLQLKVNTYKYIDQEKSDTRNYAGFLAQELEKVFPHLVHSRGDEGSDGIYTVDYSGLGVIALKAIQEQQVQLDAQEKTIQQQQAIIADLLRRLEALENK